MGWKGTMRSLGAAARRMEREAQRRHKQAEKERITSEASDAVDSWENYIDDLLSIHTDLAEYIDWHEMLDKPVPEKPNPSNKYETRAKKNLDDFKPGFFDFMKGGTSKRKKALDEALAAAPAKDKAANENALQEYEEALADWENDRSLAKRLVDGEAAAIHEVISEMQTMSTTDLLGSSVAFTIEDNFVHARPQVHSDEIVPNYRRKQLASGKLSQTKMPVSQFNELYQDYVASVALKVAGDVFQMLPIEEVYVTCESEMLNSKTGHIEATPILSVRFVRQTMERLKLNDVDPSDAITNFVHNMKFSKTKGFSRIEPIERAVVQD